MLGRLFLWINNKIIVQFAKYNLSIIQIPLVRVNVGVTGIQKRTSPIKREDF